MIILQYEDLYDDGDVSLDSAYLYMIIIDNISVTCAMYALVLFYSVTKEELDHLIQYLNSYVLKQLYYLLFGKVLLLQF